MVKVRARQKKPSVAHVETAIGALVAHARLAGQTNIDNATNEVLQRIGLTLRDYGFTEPFGAEYPKWRAFVRERLAENLGGMLHQGVLAQVAQTQTQEVA